MSAVGVTENVKGDVRKFELWCSGREVVYMVQVLDLLFIVSLASSAHSPPMCVSCHLCVCLFQAPTVEVKVTWLTEIRKVLANQLKLRQGHKSDCFFCKTLNSSHLTFLFSSFDECDLCVLCIYR